MSSIVALGPKAQIHVTEVGDRPDEQAGTDEQQREGDLRQNERPAQRLAMCRYRPARAGSARRRGRARAPPRGRGLRRIRCRSEASRQRTTGRWIGTQGSSGGPASATRRAPRPASATSMPIGHSRLSVSSCRTRRPAAAERQLRLNSTAPADRASNRWRSRTMISTPRRRHDDPAGSGRRTPRRPWRRGGGWRFFRAVRRVRDMYSTRPAAPPGRACAWATSIRTLNARSTG